MGERLSENEITDDDFERSQGENPVAVVNSKEAAYYFQIFKKYHPQKSVLNSIGIWTGFGFAEEREKNPGPSLFNVSRAAIALHRQKKTSLTRPYSRPRKLSKTLHRSDVN